MYPFSESLSWQTGLVWYGISTATAFLVSWAITDLVRVRRTPYIAILATTTGLLTWLYVSETGAGLAFWSGHWGAGIVGGVIAGAILVAQARKIPASEHPHGSELARLFAWEHVLYGITEGLLLTVLPIAAIWQVFRSVGWTQGFARIAVASAVSVLASLVLVVVHHLGYWEFRGALMRYPIRLCAVLSLAYVVTGSPIAPVLAHIVMHAAMTLRGVELPPHVHVTHAAAA
jgi:hypothetical protein